MGLRRLHDAESMFIDDGITDGANFPPSSNAVYDALENAGGGVLGIPATYDTDLECYVIEKSFNDLLGSFRNEESVTVFIEWDESEGYKGFEVCHLSLLSDSSEMAGEELTDPPYSAQFFNASTTYTFYASTADENMKTSNG